MAKHLFLSIRLILHDESKKRERDCSLFSVVSEIQDSEHFERDLMMAASLEEDLFNPLPPGLTGL